MRKIITTLSILLAAFAGYEARQPKVIEHFTMEEIHHHDCSVQSLAMKIPATALRSK